MSNGEVRKVSLQDIQLVQNLIERCLQLYMSQREVVKTLLHQAKIEPSFTELVWQKLEAENQDFFRAYHMRLVVKDQISRFNQLLEKQAELMDQMSKAKVAPSIASEAHPTAPHVRTVGMASLQPCAQVGDNLAAGHGGKFDGARSVLLVQGLNAGARHGANGAIIKAEDGYPGKSAVFGIDSNLVDHQNVIGEVSISPFSGGESHAEPVADSFLDLEMNSFGFLGQIPRNFSLSDLTADFSNSADILGSYSRSPFLATETNYLDSHAHGEQDIKKLDTISEGFACEDFGSE